MKKGEKGKSKPVVRMNKNVEAHNLCVCIPEKK